VIVHLVLLQPRGDLTDVDRERALDALRDAGSHLPDVRRFQLGRRVRHGLPGYEQMMRENYEYALLVEVDDMAALERYLRAPAHDAIGGLFTTAASAALAYDYELDDLLS
jgi:hypothetical protein